MQNSISESRRISITGMLICIVLMLAAGSAVFVVMQRHTEALLGRTLALTLRVRVERLVDAFDAGIATAQVVAAAPNVISAMQGLDDIAQRAVNLAELQRTAQSLVARPFSALAFYDQRGNRVFSVGAFKTDPELAMSLATRSSTTSARLIEAHGTVLHVDIIVIANGRRVGRVSAETSLPVLDALLADAHSFGRTGILALCAPVQRDAMDCLRTTLKPHALGRIPRRLNGNPLPMSNALNGQTGIHVGSDHRGETVVAVYRPVNDYGLGMVIKVDTAELYFPIYKQLRVIIPALLLLMVAGAGLLGWQVMPLVRRLVQSESAAHESRRRLTVSESDQRLLTALAPVGIFRADHDGNNIFVNEQFCALTGLSQAQARGRGWIEVVPVEDRGAVSGAWQEAARLDQAIQIEHRFCRVDGSIIWVFAQVMAQRDAVGTLTGFIGALTDITERKRAEEALRDSEDRYRSVVAAMSDGIVIQRADERIVACNPSAERILGVSEDQILGHTSMDPQWQTFREDGAPFPAEEHPPVVTLRTGRPQHGILMGLRRPDGSDTWIVVNSQPLTRVGETKPYAVVSSFSDITDRKRSERALIQSESNFRALTENANVGILVHFHGRHVFANQCLLTMLGYTLEEFRDTTMEDVVHPDEYATVLSRYEVRRVGDEESNVYETLLRARDGRTIPVELTATTTIWQGSPAGLVLLQDISERRRAEEHMQKLSSAVEQIADMVIITNTDGVIEYVNPAFEEVTGYGAGEAIGQTPRILKSGKQGRRFYKKVWDTLLANEVFSDVFVNRRKNGSLYYEEKTITPLKDTAGRITHFVSTGKDVTERMEIHERLQYIAQHDALTDLPNRVLMFDILKRALARARRHDHLVAVLFIDLDRFKFINDSLGHEVGDKLLQQLAERIRGAVRDEDTVARFGGDEFVILLDDVTLESNVRDVTQKILTALIPPFDIDSQMLYVTASIGVSLFPADGDDSSTLLKHADVAMYRAKDMGKNTYQFYSADMSARAFERLTLESNLRHALSRNEFLLHYQPQVDLASGAIIGVEALLRWQHPEFGLVMPVEFMTLLEETGLVVPTGEWVLQEACAQLRVWHDAGWKGLRMAVNLSARQFNSSALADAVANALARLDGNPDQLELEITESVLMQHAAATVDTLEKLAGMGCRLSIDDFGTGYSSLAYLKRFPIDVLKIDRTFVRDVPEDRDDAAIVSTIIAMAHNLKQKVIAEGVETEAQLAFLRACGCNGMQGYLFSRPVPADEIPRLLQRPLHPMFRAVGRHSM